MEHLSIKVKGFTLYQRAALRHGPFDGNLTYKYHLAYCSTLNHMEKREDSKKDISDSKSESKIYSKIIDKLTGKFHDENKLCKMDVCKNCLSKLSKQYITDNLFYYDNSS